MYTIVNYVLYIYILLVYYYGRGYSIYHVCMIIGMYDMNTYTVQDILYSTGYVV